MIAAAMLVLVSGWYALGVHRLWRRTSSRRAVGRVHVLAFATGIAIAGLSQLPLVDAAAHDRFWVHMVQHELILVAAAPLLAIGRPGMALPHALPMRLRGMLAGTRLRAVRRAGRTRGFLVAAFVLHSIAIWLWHLPVPYEAAAAGALVHGLQHGSFFATAMLFWMAVLRAARSRVDAPLALLASFGIVLHTGVLGALLTLASSPLYDTYVSQLGVPAALADQQLGGLVMWVPGCMAYVALGLVIAWGLVVERHPSRDGSPAIAPGGAW